MSTNIGTGRTQIETVWCVTRLSNVNSSCLKITLLYKVLASNTKKIDQSWFGYLFFVASIYGEKNVCCNYKVWLKNDSVFST